MLELERSRNLVIIRGEGRQVRWLHSSSRWYVSSTQLLLTREPEQQVSLSNHLLLEYKLRVRKDLPKVKKTKTNTFTFHRNNLGLKQV